MRTYSETLDFLFSRLPMFTRVGASAYKADLNNTIALCKFLHNPEQKFKSIHIAGTNGKGSCSHMLAAVLQAQGYKTGLYTSPHLRDFRERIRINGEMISEEEVILFTEKTQDAILQIQPSFFELTMAMAFEYFADNAVEIAIIETGMGGRLDSTNIIKPELCLITNIGLDHMEFLGNNLESIAREKSGIIKMGVPVIIGKTQEETKNIFARKALEMQAPLFYADQIWQYLRLKRDAHEQVFRVQRLKETAFDIHLDLLGTYQQHNLPVVLECVHQLLNGPLHCSQDSLLNGLATVQSRTGLMGRWQTLSENPKVVCDTGHNEDGIREIIKMFGMESYEQLHIVLGMVGDKEIDKMLRLFPKDAIYYFTQASIPRALHVEDLRSKAMAIGLKGESYSRVKDALSTALSMAKTNDLVFIGGSTFVVAEVV